MDGLLDREKDCFRKLDAGVAAMAEATANRVRARVRLRGKVEFSRSVDDLLVSRDDAEPELMPPVGDLLAVTRTRTLEVVARQLRACLSTVDAGWGFLARGGVEAARLDAAVLERHWYGRVSDSLSQVGAMVREDMREQYQRWAQFDEPVDALLRRWFDAEEVRLPGAGSKGAVWAFRTRLMVEARNASVALSNGIMLAGIRGWNATEG
jgi:hypothetical protein